GQLRRHDWHLERVNQIAELWYRPRAANPVTDQQDRLLRSSHSVENGGNDIGGDRRLGRLRGESRKLRWIDPRALHSEWNVEEHGPGSAGGREMNSLLQMKPHLLRIIEKMRVLRNGLNHRNNIDLERAELPQATNWRESDGL